MRNERTLLLVMTLQMLHFRQPPEREAGTITASRKLTRSDDIKPLESQTPPGLCSLCTFVSFSLMLVSFT